MTLRIAITPGEPAGIGPDLVLQLAQQSQTVELVAIADPHLLASRAEQLGLAITLREYHQHEPARCHPAGTLTVAPVALTRPCLAGQLNPANAAYVVEMLRRACQGCIDGEFNAMVTGPVHKGVINDAGIPFSGHTEFLAAQTRTRQVVMMLATEGLRVALVTTHLPLASVPAAITQPLLTEVIRIVDHDLRHHFKIAKPRISVLGLNPHAGEGGHLGREEIDTMIPVIRQLAEQGIALTGPLPADTAFTPKHLKQCDAVLAMYHDQGLPVLKYKGFGQAVNITLGLPIIRTSVDHGTALDLAGRGNADSGSMHYALQCAIEMAADQQPT